MDVIYASFGGFRDIVENQRFRRVGGQRPNSVADKKGGMIGRNKRFYAVIPLK